MNDFADRTEAGRLLAAKLAPMKPERPLVLALPRGGVPVAVEVASALDAEMDVLFVRKIGFPSQPEFAIAAVVDGAHPQMVRNEEVLTQLPVDEAYIERERDRELAEIERRRALYCGDRAPSEVAGRTILVVDDGVATGTSVRAALAALRRSGAGRLILAVPVISPETARELRDDGIEVIAVTEPAHFMAVGQFYRDFHQLEDGEVIALLRRNEAAPRTEHA
ncbi:phosphoribosyltransferase [Sphingomonas cannabina]|uniref:phosphoribosyltransferase n=1 Tax=Sphingomonas cannabina TaxID=2899123 RepID=UPI001F3C7975|nr:phosphoribosyltransferase [Sphingomonas cannabina]UIJ45007.1 phosphoribosyltransferase [Sphingomonas cannabina]